MTQTPRAVVQLVYGSPQSGDQGRLDLRVLEQLRSMGVRRVWEASEFATEIYESMMLTSVAPTDLPTDTFVDACVDQLARVLVSLGFDQG